MSDKIILKRGVTIQKYDGPSAGGKKDVFSYLEFQDTLMTVTPVMEEILNICRKAHTVEEITQIISENHRISYKSIYPSVLAFLKRMHKIGVISTYKRNTQKKTKIARPLKRNQTFGNFIIKKKLGSNSDVTLYKCIQPDDEKIYYTLKILSDPESDHSFMREFKILNSIPPHPNIRRCITADNYDGIPYMLFDYVEGDTLSDITDEFPLKKKYKIGQQLINAIDHLHKYGILHGDIHASNVLVDSNGKVSLIDLGMAYYEHEKNVSHGGVPLYMPPERMPDHNYHFSKHEGNYVAEVFQVGVCLYLLFSGEYPFNGTLLKDLRNSIQNSTPPALLQTEKGEVIPAAVSRIIFKALNKDPAARYQSLTEMSQEWRIAIKNRNIKQSIF